jgi:hypothetical protein
MHEISGTGGIGLTMSEVKQLRQKALNSMLLSIGHYNGLSDVGRTEAVLFFQIHAFEMLLKAGLLKKGCDIRTKDKKRTITFDDCVKQALSNGDYKFLDDDQALLLNCLNGFRNEAHHHLLILREEILYTQAQAAVTLFRDILKSQFGIRLEEHLPARVLPLATVAPSNPTLVFRDEVDAVRKLLAPGLRRGMEAGQRLKAVAILEDALAGEDSQPEKSRLDKLALRVKDGEEFETLFPAVSAVGFSVSGENSTFALRLNKHAGVAVRYAREGTEGVAIVLKPVHDLDHYNLTHTNVRERLGLNASQVSSALTVLGARKDKDLSLEVVNGNYRYCEAVLEKIRDLRSGHSDREITQKARLIRETG